MVKEIKGWRMSSRTYKVVVKHLNGAKTKDMKSNFELAKLDS